MVNKSSQSMTLVGGSAANNADLPAFGIVPGKSFDLKWVHGFPSSAATDPRTKEGFKPVWICNESGGMTNEVMMEYLEKVIIPFCHKATAENKYVLICDGCTMHIYLPFLEQLKENNIRLVFRIPHST